MINIVMIEDDVELASMLTSYLRQFNIQVTNYDDPFIALSKLNLTKYDLVILDLTLPGLDGLEVCKEIVKKHKLPIIISSARSDITDKVTALEIGADDYLPKPYDPRELEVRIKTILRRYNIQINSTTTNQKDKIFKLNCDKKEITKNGEFIKFTAAEYEIFSIFIKREGFVISREDIYENCNILSSDDDTNGSLAVILNRIRQKIEANPKSPEFLQTIRGMGYRFMQ
ncbi:MAG: response regulator transcription factor [Arcobacteraceae bacterium]|nr:response regulator transcription factor [Arcobacteraceae bacterium]MDY0326797.1 response regulator transcription factor [Arcobacteraceae bacterium]